MAFDQILWTQNETRRMPNPRAQFPTCREEDPQLEPFHEGQVAACHFPLIAAP